MTPAEKHIIRSKIQYRQKAIPKLIGKANELAHKYHKLIDRKDRLKESLNDLKTTLIGEENAKA